MPTPDPSLIPNALGSFTPIFTDNYSTIILAIVSLVGVVTVPVIVVKGGLRWVVGGLRKLFRGA